MDPNIAATPQPNYSEVNTPPASPNPLQTPPTNTVPQKSGSLFMKIMIPVIAILLIAAGAIGYMVYQRNLATQELSSLVDSQLKSFNAIEKDYKDTEELLKLIDTRQDGNDAEQTSNEQLLRVEKTPAFGESDVLGIEEDLNIDIERKMAEMFREVSTEVDTIAKTTEKVSNLKSKSPIHGMFLPDTTEIVTKTETFITETKPLMDYLNETTMLGIESTTTGLDIGLALNEAIIRGADEASLNNYQKKLQALEGIKNKFETIDTSGLDKTLQDEHRASLSSLDEDMALFKEIEEALIKKDIVLLDKAISSLLLQGQADSVSSQVGRLSFWQNNKTIQSLASIKSDWKEFQDSELK